MYLKTSCAKCGQGLTVREEFAGRRVRCPYCQTTMTIPMMSAAPSTEGDSPQASLMNELAAAGAANRSAAGSAASTARTSARNARTKKTESESDGTNVNPLTTAAAGVALTAIWYAALAIFPKTYFWSLFWDRGWVPFVEAFLMFWSAAILAAKWRLLNRQRQSMLFDLLPSDIAADISESTLAKFTTHVTNLPIPPNESFLINRVLRGLQHFRVRGSASEVSSMIGSQSSIDATAVGSSYTLVKVFIWAIPILGFIGTVQGLGDAVGGFSGKMAGATDISVVKDSLGDITKGLGVAFDTTLIALVMSLILMMPMSQLQKAEEDLLNWVDEYCNENLIKRLDDGGGGAGSENASSTANEKRLAEAAIAKLTAAHQAELAQWTKKLDAIGTALAKEVIGGWKKAGELQKLQHQENLAGFQATSSELIQKQQQVADGLLVVQQRLADDQSRVAQNAEAAIHSTHEQLTAMCGTLAALNDVLGQLGGKQIVVEMRPAEVANNGRWWPFGRRRS